MLFLIDPHTYIQVIKIVSLSLASVVGTFFYQVIFHTLCNRLSYVVFVNTLVGTFLYRVI